MSERPPMPGEWDSYYDDKPWLAEWLTRRNPQVVVLPDAHELEAGWNEPPRYDVDLPRRTITLKKAAGPAPFVGDPLWMRGFYEWPIGVDDAGRMIAGDAELVLIVGPTF